MLSQFSAMVNDATSVSVHFLFGAVAVAGNTNSASIVKVEPLE
jgi:hypothetical protein